MRYCVRMCLRVCTHTSRAPGGSLSVCICLLASSGIWGCSPRLMEYLLGSVFVYPGSLSPASVGTRRCSQPTAFARLPYLHGARGSRWETLCPPWGHGDERRGGVRPLQVGKGRRQEDGSRLHMCCPPCHRLREARLELAGGCALSLCHGEPSLHAGKITQWWKPPPLERGTPCSALWPRGCLAADIYRAICIQLQKPEGLGGFSFWFSLNRSQLVRITT